MSSTPIPAPSPPPPPPPLDILRILGHGSDSYVRIDAGALRDKLLAVEPFVHLPLVMNDLLIIMPSQYKMQGGPEHEFMGFTAVLHNVVVGFLELHRTLPQLPIPVSKAVRNKARKAAKGRPATTILQHSTSLTDTFDAYDTVKVATASHIAESRLGDPLICEATAPNTRRLYHLYAAMAVIHDYAPLYNSLQYQCYWYATAVRFLVASEGHEEFRYALAVTKATDVEPSRVVGKKSNAGTHKSVALTNQKTVDQIVADLSGLYEAKVTEIELMLNQKIEVVSMAQESQDAKALAGRERVAREAAEKREEALLAQATEAAKREEAAAKREEAAAKREAELLARLAAFENSAGVQRE